MTVTSNSLHMCDDYIPCPDDVNEPISTLFSYDSANQNLHHSTANTVSLAYMIVTSKRLEQN